MILLKGLKRRARRQARETLDTLIVESVCKDCIPKTRYGIQDYLREQGFEVSDETIGRHAKKLLYCLTYREIRKESNTLVSTEFRMPDRTQFYLPKDANMREKALRRFAYSKLQKLYKYEVS
ncbi:MAG: hypothetical protein PHC66_01900 [Candidatus Nanoarchaeia archaeon]|nr:hypothetical protein [Candidatus Nanoarchaeia archaeon]MDD5239041.1 hypothetical protein [Candidatus Nanoarchaeia archaeon]